MAFTGVKGGIVNVIVRGGGGVVFLVVIVVPVVVGPYDVQCFSYEFARWLNGGGGNGVLGHCGSSNH